MQRRSKNILLGALPRAAFYIFLHISRRRWRVDAVFEKCILLKFQKRAGAGGCLMRVTKCAPPRRVVSAKLLRRICEVRKVRPTGVRNAGSVPHAWPRPVDLVRVGRPRLGILNLFPLHSSSPCVMLREGGRTVSYIIHQSLTVYWVSNITYTPPLCTSFIYLRFTRLLNYTLNA